MERSTPEGAVDGRRAPRSQLDGAVKLRYAAGTISGSGDNIATQGIFFVADGSLPVAVEIDGWPAAVSGTLVRLESMGDGRFGIAVRFDEPLPRQ